MTPEERLRAILEAAVAVFLRFGFRKTSMDEVARAAHLSRQGLYLHFSTKEDLFRAALQHAFESSLAAASGALSDASLDLEARLTTAMDEWLGRTIGVATSSAADLAEASGGVAGPMHDDYEGSFLEALTKALRSSGLPAAYKPAGLSARQLASTLLATARGLKHTCASRKAFGEDVSVAVRALCFPLRTSA